MMLTAALLGIMASSTLAWSSTTGGHFSELRKIAETSLKGNIYHLKKSGHQKKESIPSFEEGDYLTAGSHQFKALWTRDFCFASRGLFAIGRKDIVRRQLSLILDHVRERDLLVPRYFGSASHLRRRFGYATHTAINLGGHLEAEYDAGGGGEGAAADSNVLVILTALDYVKRTGDQTWWTKYQPKIVQAFKHYDRIRDIADGLIKQGAFADWQDSVSREGKTFFVNVLYYAMLERLADRPEFGVNQDSLAILKNQIIKTFRDPATGLFLSVAGYPQISLDGNLLAIDLGFHDKTSNEAKALYDNLKNHALWKSQDIPGYATEGRYPIEWVGKLPKFVNVADYHDLMYWSWLIALSGKVAKLMGDTPQVDRVLGGLQVLAHRDHSITEVYEHNSPHKPVYRVINQKFLAYFNYKVYKAEAPFSWGAGLTLDALETP